MAGSASGTPPPAAQPAPSTSAHYVSPRPARQTPFSATERARTNCRPPRNTALSPNAKDVDGKAPLLSAIKNDLLEFAQLLLAAGANANAKDVDGTAALLCAASFGHTKLGFALLAAGAEVDAADRDGATALLIAAEVGDTELALGLLKAGACSNVRVSLRPFPVFLFCAALFFLVAYFLVAYLLLSIHSFSPDKCRTSAA